MEEKAEAGAAKAVLLGAEQEQTHVTMAHTHTHQQLGGRKAGSQGKKEAGCGQASPPPCPWLSPPSCLCTAVSWGPVVPPDHKDTIECDTGPQFPGLSHGYSPRAVIPQGSCGMEGDSGLKPCWYRTGRWVRSPETLCPLRPGSDLCPVAALGADIGSLKDSGPSEAHWLLSSFPQAL